jgi:hypothetical protein
MNDMHANLLFNRQRFLRLFLNELLTCQKKVLMATVLLFAMLLFFYAQHVYDVNGAEPVPNISYLFPMFIVCALFASVIFNDMHHPLERYHFLTLPCSNLERWLCKYLITGPLLLLYATVLYEIFKVVAPVITEFYGGRSAAFYNIEEMTLPRILVIFFSVHIWFFLGAILFHSYSLVRSGLAFVALCISFVLMGQLSGKIFYFNHFESLFSMQTVKPIGQGIGFYLFSRVWLFYLYWGLLYLWLAWISFAALKDHEV